MAKSFKDVVLESLRTGLGIPTNIKKPNNTLEPITLFVELSLNFTSSGFLLIDAYATLPRSNKRRAAVDTCP